LFKNKQTSETLPIKKNTPLRIELETTDSTNNYAMQLIHEGVAQHGTVIVAHHQESGKGQRGKNWESPPGESLSYSLLLQPHFLNPGQVFQLQAMVAVMTHSMLTNHIGEECTIKWPNDLYWRDRKAGGILIENILQGGVWNWTVIGIGINMNQPRFQEFLPNPVSLRQITGKCFSANDLADELTHYLENGFRQLQQNGFNELFNRYNEILYKKNEAVTLLYEQRRMQVVLNGVNEQGQLLAGENDLMQFDFGTVSWLL
jgi:BirA family biotin operon repressor/biotin-[acetyl-CoA-carboxylase] ligase